MIRCIAFHVSPTPFFHFERTNTSISTSGVIFDGKQKREKKKKEDSGRSATCYYYTVLLTTTTVTVLLSLWGLTSLRGLGMVFAELSPLLPRSGVVNPPSYGLLCVVPPSHARSPGKGKQKCGVFLIGQALPVQQGSNFFFHFCGIDIK